MEASTQGKTRTSPLGVIAYLSLRFAQVVARSGLARLYRLSGVLKR
jgi:hypothetical protein